MSARTSVRSVCMSARTAARNDSMSAPRSARRRWLSAPNSARKRWLSARNSARRAWLSARASRLNVSSRPMTVAPTARIPMSSGVMVGSCGVVVAVAGGAAGEEALDGAFKAGRALGQRLAHPCGDRPDQYRGLPTRKFWHVGAEFLAKARGCRHVELRPSRRARRA